MTEPKLTKLELQIMDALWTRRQASIRDIQEAFPEKHRPAYTTIQTTVYRLETKKTLRRARKISHAHIFEPLISRSAAQSRLIDDLLALFGDRLQPVMAHLVESRRLTLDDIRDAEKAVLALQEEEDKEVGQHGCQDCGGQGEPRLGALAEHGYREVSHKHGLYQSCFDTPTGRILRTSGSARPRTMASVVSLAIHSAAHPAVKPRNSPHPGRSPNACRISAANQRR